MDRLRCFSIPSHHKYLIPYKLNQMYPSWGWRYDSSFMSGEWVYGHTRPPQVNSALVNKILNSMSQRCITVCVMTCPLVVSIMKIYSISW